MAKAIRMPLLSDTMTEGKIIQWNKKVGDKVKSDDTIAEVETDKATMDVVGYEEGTLLYIGVKTGEAAKVNDIIAIVGKEGEDYKSLLESDGDNSDKKKKEPVKKESEQKPKEEQKEKAVEIKAVAELPKDAKVIRMPLLSDTMTEGKIVQWNKKVGDKVKSDDSIAEVETDKATMDVVGYEEGTLLYIGVEAGQAAKVNEIIAIVGKEGTDVSAYVNAEKNKSAETPANKPQAEKQSEEISGSTIDKNEGKVENIESSSEGGRVKASPLAKKLAADKGIDISKIQGSGDGGRIVKKDVDAYKPAPAQAKEEGKKEADLKPVQPFEQTGKESYEDIPNTQMRKTIARRLGESMFNAPHFYLTMEINMDNAMSSRVAINEISPVKISFNDMVIKACAMALRQHPAVNSSWMGDFIRQNKHIHIGSAVAMPDGLIVPVIRFADQKSLSQIASDAKGLYDKARNKKLQPEEFSGNTFTISNLGMMDIEDFTAIINPPDSAILAVGRIKEIVVKKADGFGVTNVMKVTLSCDHRSVDGAVGAAFLQTFKKFMENPVTMLV
ncbi:pyruvate dehydrogenase complex dihydrolipoamide acetyltransferase [Ginsengibacter hankyongi]|uniref:Acetyltransferase component of pyruvate dehydrogenase complex n=1 Tax=Ginsengibacter hankyongi TaxID=2607284 RepID=A0A5J5INX7_9BACT|nr:pyruvate dehydrogenase complex dihydrolipoamide acetyltransferase [Ginsengibacter hankyongi]KAA9041707.1 pyruvate dehydrogenase complex dihydrolipoamide acetyltransferase [Ginsengibacter hankyongi]